MTATSEVGRQAVASPGIAPEDAADGARWQGLSAAATAVGVSLNEAQLDCFAAYRDLLLEWNSRTNLTAVNDPVEVERRLFLDAVVMVPAVDALLGAQERGIGARRLVDVGSGAGFPGLALKIVRPALDVTLIEATGKKVAFLAAAIAQLGLIGVSAVHGRAEELGRDPAFRGAYDLATARAVASLPSLLELCVPFLRVGGHALFPKGAAIANELVAGEGVAPLLGSRVIGPDLLPGGNHLIRVEKTAPTPDRYPRRSGIPARAPLGSANEPIRRRPMGRSGRSER